MSLGIGDECYVDVRGTLIKGSIIGHGDYDWQFQFRGNYSPTDSLGFSVEKADCFPDLESALEHFRNKAAIYAHEAENCERLIEAEEAQSEEEAADDKMQAGRNAA